MRQPSEHEPGAGLGTQGVPGHMDLLPPLSVAQTKSLAKDHTGQKGSQASHPGPRVVCSPGRHSLSVHCAGAEASRLMVGYLPLCVKVHVPVCLFCFVFPWKENKPKANTACILTSLGAVETSNCPGQEGFPVGLSVHVQRQPAAEG